MVEKKKLMGMTLAELQQVAAEVGLPGYTAKQMAKKTLNLKTGDRILITGGTSDTSGNTNTIRIATI